MDKIDIPNDNNRELELLVISDVANILGVHVTTIEKMIRNKEIVGPFKLRDTPKSKRYWTRAMIKEWIDGLSNKSKPMDIATGNYL